MSENINYLLEELQDINLDDLGYFITNPASWEGIFSAQVAKNVISVFNSCKTEHEFKIANDMFKAINGENIESLIFKISELENDYNRMIE